MNRKRLKLESDPQGRSLNHVCKNLWSVIILFLKPQEILRISLTTQPIYSQIKLLPKDEFNFAKKELKWLKKLQEVPDWNCLFFPTEDESNFKAKSANFCKIPQEWLPKALDNFIYLRSIKLIVWFKGLTHYMTSLSFLNLTLNGTNLKDFF